MDPTPNQLLLPKNVELEKHNVSSNFTPSNSDGEQMFPNGIDRSPVDLKPQKKVKIIDKYFEQIGYSKYQYIQIFIASLVNIVIGVESLIPNLVVVQIQKEMNVQLFQAAMLVAAFGLGAGVGTFLFFIFLFQVLYVFVVKIKISKMF